jgi:hypothetical protein
MNKTQLVENVLKIALEHPVASIFIILALAVLAAVMSGGIHIDVNL